MKKLIIAVLMLVVVLSTSVFAATFTDVADTYWAKAAIDRWVEEEVITGYPDDTYKPKSYITRAEFSSLVVKLFEPETKADISKYTDVKETAWYYDAMAKAMGMKAIEEATSTTLRPNANVTRQEAVVILNSILGFEAKNGKESLKEFTDYNEIADYAEDDIAAFAEKEYVIGYPDGSFQPSGTITRAEAAQILSRVLALIIKEEGEYDLANVDDTVLVKAENVTLKNADKANLVFLNDKIKSSLKGLTNTQKDKFIVINKDADSSSKSTGRKSSSYTSNSSVKVAVIEVKTVTHASGDYYTITRNNNDVAIGKKISIKVDGKYIVKEKMVEDSEKFIDYLKDVANVLETEKVINTLERDASLTDENILLWEKETAKAILAEVSVETSVAIIAAGDEEHKVSSIYHAMIANGIEDSTIKAKALEILSTAYADTNNTAATFETISAKLNAFKS